MKIPKYALPHRVTVIPYKGAGPYGPIYDSLRKKKNVPCRIEPKTTVTRGTNGEDITVRAVAMFHPDYTIRPNDRIEWSLSGATYTIQELTPIDAMGLSHFEGVLV